jgi:hypothetical protein
MKRLLTLFLVLGLFAIATSAANAAGNVLINGNLDQTYQQEIVPGFFLPKPSDWENVGTRAISGPYEDEMSSEPWAGPAPTPVTSDGVDPDGPGGNPGDWGVFFKPFSGNATDGAATGHLYQDNPGTPGMKYILTGWAGAEPNALMADAVFAIDFLDGGGGGIGGASLSLMPTLFIDNGEPYDYKQYMVMAIAPPGTATVRARASMIDAVGNPAGGGQAFVVDDFELRCVPEPASVALGLIGVMGLLGLVRRHR